MFNNTQILTVYTSKFSRRLIFAVFVDASNPQNLSSQDFRKQYTCNSWSGKILSVKCLEKEICENCAQLKFGRIRYMLIINYSRIATKANWPPSWLYYASNAYISAKTGTTALMKAYIWSTRCDKANLKFSSNWRQRHWQSTKPESSKIANCSYSFSSHSLKMVYTPG